MALVEKSALVPYSALQMFELVSQIEKYPEFLPWCSSAELKAQEPDRIVATLSIAFKGIRQSFTTENRHTGQNAIDMALVDGPFRQLTGRWEFVVLRENACKVSLRLEYEFSSRLLEQVVGPVFGNISNSMVDGFIARADQLYG
jgi:ribosome-associated toxin RatA of RatAB toxin-antitoxin module